jgi:hypothetical protein
MVRVLDARSMCLPHNLYNHLHADSARGLKTKTSTSKRLCAPFQAERASAAARQTHLTQG